MVSFYRQNEFLGVLYQRTENHSVSCCKLYHKKKRCQAKMKEEKQVNEFGKIAVTMSEAAQLLSVSRPTIYRLAKMEGFPVTKIEGCTRVFVDDLSAWVRRRAMEKGK